MSQMNSQPTVVARRLFEDDLPTIVEINFARPDVMRRAKPYAYDDAFEDSLHSTYLHRDSRRGALIGAFVDGRLDAYLSVYLWRDFPYFSIGNLKTRPGFVSLFSRRLSAFGACIQGALDFAESRAAFRGYMIHALHRWPAERVRKSLAQSFPGVDRYHYEIELVVPSGTRPPYAYAWSLMGQRLWAQDLAVETITLKQECRAAPRRALCQAA